MDIVRRVQDILLKPKETWPVIDHEPVDTGKLYTQYLMILAAIPALAAFIGMSLIGAGAFGISVRVPILWGLSSMLVNYVLTLVMVYVIALVVDALAPTFGGTKNKMQALKLVAFGSTASFVGGIFYLIPALSMLSLLAALYSIYLFYLGLPVLMKCSKDKAIAYTVVVGLVTIVGSFVIGAIAAAVTPGSMMTAGAGGGGAVSISTPKGEVSIDTAKIEAMGKQMEQVAQRMEQQASAGALDAQQLKAFLPETLNGLKRESIEAMGDGNSIISAASATYVSESGDKRVELTLTDVGGGLGAAAAMWAMVNVDREADGEVEKIYKQGARSVHERWRKDGSDAEYKVILANGTMVGADGSGVDFNTLKAAVATVNLDKVEGLQRTATVAKQ